MNKPFGWYIAGMIFEGKDGEQEAKDFENGLSKDGYEEKAIPLYTHPHPDNLGLALSIIDQQKLEIDELKKECAWAKDQWNKDRICFEATKAGLEKQLDTRTRELIGASFYEHDYKTMMADNEPVGYYYAKSCFDIRDCSEQMKRNGNPLYTHPVKEITDEEILNVAFCSEISTVSIENDWGGTVLEFARAILRKAQEK